MSRKHLVTVALYIFDSLDTGQPREHLARSPLFACGTGREEVLKSYSDFGKPWHYEKRYSTVGRRFPRDWKPWKGISLMIEDVVVEESQQ
jgi:hypothetical protein